MTSSCARVAGSTHSGPRSHTPALSAIQTAAAIWREEPLAERRPNMAEPPEEAGKSFDIEEELNSSVQSVLEVYSDIKDTIRRSIKEIESSQNAPVQFHMTSTPKSKEVIRDRMYIPFPIKDRNPEKDNEECDERHHNSTYRSSEAPFMARDTHLGSDISFELSSVEYPALPLKADEEPKNSLNYTSYHILESKDPLVLFEGHDDQLFEDQTLTLSELKGKHSDTEEMESGQIEMTDISLQLSGGRMSAPVTNVSQFKDHSVELTVAEVASLDKSNVLLYTRDTRIGENSVDSPCWSTMNTDHLGCVTPTTICHDCAASEERVVDQMKTFKNEYYSLQRQFKNMGDRDISRIKNGDEVFRIQELESYLTESDQLHMQEQRLKSKTFGVQMAIKHIRINEQCLKDENLRYREQISRLKTEKNFLQLRLSKAEQDGEEYVHEIKTVTDKCEELLNQRKRFQDERNHLSVEKQFFVKEIEDLKREKKINAEQLASVTAEKDKLVKTLNSTKTTLFRYAKEKQDLQSRLREVLVENYELRRKINANKTEQLK